MYLDRPTTTTVRSPFGGTDTYTLETEYLGHSFGYVLERVTVGPLGNLAGYTAFTATKAGHTMSEPTPADLLRRFITSADLQHA